MVKPAPEQIHRRRRQQQQPPPPPPLKCPRCYSTNTKFCYYNNYSSSQPRHLCKDCKKYWTRGGTIRNLPVGGGRKNKRVKRPTPSSVVVGRAADVSAAAISSTGMNPTAAHPPQIEISSASKHMNPLFYGLPNNPSEMNFSFSRCDDLHPHQLNDLGLGFSSVILNGGDEFRNGCNSSKPSIYDLISSSSVLPNYNYTFRSSSPSSCFTTKTTSTPSVSSVLLASNLQQQQIFMSSGLKNSQADSLFKTSLPYDYLQTKDSNNQIDQPFVGSSDPSILWSGTTISSWIDPSNLGSSMPNLI